ncbi:MAG: DUF2203 domain-containing protein [Deinococcales bacterium]
MYRLFTLTEATRLLPVVDEHLGALQGAAADVAQLRERLADLSGTSVEANNVSKEIAFLLGVIHGSKAELDRLGVQIRDVEEGLVDFPSQLGAEVVCLTWEKGQDAITHYHALSGDTATRPLPPGLGEATNPAEGRRSGPSRSGNSSTSA